MQSFITDKSPPTRPPDVTIPGQNGRCSISVWIKESCFVLGGDSHNLLWPTINMGQYGCLTHLEYLEHVAHAQTEDAPLRAKVALDYLSEMVLLGPPAGL